jgi:hypothetical protein
MSVKPGPQGTPVLNSKVKIQKSKMICMAVYLSCGMLKQVQHDFGEIVVWR